MKALRNSGRYKALKLLIEKNEIKTFSHVFEIVPRTELAKDMGINYNRLGNKVLNPDKFSVKDIRSMAKLIDVDANIILSFINALLIRKRKLPALKHKRIKEKDYRPSKSSRNSHKV